tara:strand:- start:519 stop:692 length:174 start_codon:yes stop_codon:yes gene_type:complete
MIKTDVFNMCVEFLLSKKKIKESSAKDVKIVYRTIQITNEKLFCELKKELIENGWVA